MLKYKLEGTSSIEFKALIKKLDTLYFADGSIKENGEQNNASLEFFYICEAYSEHTSHLLRFSLINDFFCSTGLILNYFCTQHKDSKIRMGVIVQPLFTSIRNCP